MNKELVIQTSKELIEIALLEDKKLVELHQQKFETELLVGDFYLGKVKKIMPSLNAVFLDIGYKQDAFLHYSDLSPNIKSIIKFTKDASNSNHSINQINLTDTETSLKDGKINSIFSGKPLIIVQILKEPISNKGPRLTCEFSLPGRFIVVTPFSNTISISKKIISTDERKRLNKIISSFQPKNCGVIARTAAENIPTAEIHKDLNTVYNNWKLIEESLKQSLTPRKLFSEGNKTTNILRDLLTAEFNNIVCNDLNLYQTILLYIKRIDPEKLNIVSHYKQKQSIFDTYNVNKQIKSSFGKKIILPSGAYLIFEKTEALYVIDVNSGNKNSVQNQEENAYTTNIESAEEIARQLRLRDIGGIIVIDFIDMHLPENKKRVQEALTNFMKSDRAKHTIAAISKFGTLQLTRQRMRPEILMNTTEDCLACKGTGKMISSVILEDEIERHINLLSQNGHKKLLLKVNPILNSYLTKGFFNSIKKKWSKHYKLKLKIEANNELHLNEFLFFDSYNESIVI